MPSKIPRSCSVWPCGEIATVRGKCPRHAGQAEAARNVARARSLAVYRSKRWRTFRRRILLDRPWCEWPEGCREAATDVDHIKTIEERPDLAFEESNAMPLCHPHHSKKTATVDRARRRTR